MDSPPKIPFDFHLCCSFYFISFHSIDYFSPFIFPCVADTRGTFWCIQWTVGGGRGGKKREKERKKEKQKERKKKDTFLWPFDFISFLYFSSFSSFLLFFSFLSLSLSLSLSFLFLGEKKCCLREIADAFRCDVNVDLKHRIGAASNLNEPMRKRIEGTAESVGVVNPLNGGCSHHVLLIDFQWIWPSDAPASASCSHILTWAWINLISPITSNHMIIMIRADARLAYLIQFCSKQQVTFDCWWIKLCADSDRGHGASRAINIVNLLNESYIDLYSYHRVHYERSARSRLVKVNVNHVNCLISKKKTAVIEWAGSHVKSRPM